MAASRSTSPATWVMRSGQTMAAPESLVMAQKMAASSNTACCSEAVGFWPLPFPAVREERKS
eukprot:3566873-Pyramimonas_sp.AAC.1